MNRDRLTRWLCASIVALAALEFGVATVAYQIRLPPPQHTDFASYYMAGRFAREGRSPYEAAALRQSGALLRIEQTTYPFVYPPVFAWAMQPLASLPFARARQVWMLGTTIALAAALLVLWRLLRSQARTLDVDDSAVWIVFAAAVAATLNSAGVHSDLRLGSVGAPLLLCMSVIAACMLRGGRPAGWCGAALAVAVLLKVTPIVLIAWVAWRGARRAAAIALAVLAVSALPPLWSWGPRIYLDWLQAGLATRLGGTDGWAVNQSLDAVLQRFFDPSTMVVARAEAPLVPRVIAIVLGALAVAVTARVLMRRHGMRPGSRRAFDLDAWAPVELGVLVALLLLTMQLTWVHTLTAIAFAWPVTMLALWSRARGDDRVARTARRCLLATAVGAFLSSAHLPFLWSSVFHHYPWIVVTAAHCVGLAILWMAALRGVARVSEPPTA